MIICHERKSAALNPVWMWLTVNNKWLEKPQNHLGFLEKISPHDSFWFKKNPNKYPCYSKQRQALFSLHKMESYVRLNREWTVITHGWQTYGFFPQGGKLFHVQRNLFEVANGIVSCLYIESLSCWLFGQMNWTAEVLGVFKISWNCQPEIRICWNCQPENRISWNCWPESQLIFIESKIL
jgi:hypothetical protein